MKTLPTVAVMITARNRRDELRLTLRQLKQQDYPAIELIVVDDASDESLEPVVREEWPTAIFERNEVCRGLVANRSRGMKMAGTEYIVSLDDDSCFTEPSDLRKAVARMEAEPELGVLTFLVYQAPVFVSLVKEQFVERYVPSFFGCAHMVRSSVVHQIGGYHDFYFYCGEEVEYSLRIWDAGWRILFYPSVLVHHRISSIGRRHEKIIRYSTRNYLWTPLLHLPAGRAFMVVSWRVFSYALEAVRLWEPRAYVTGLLMCVQGLPRIWRLRKPISGQIMATLDGIDAATVRTPAELGAIKQADLASLLSNFFSRWVSRPRARTAWDHRKGDLGNTSTVVFEHSLNEASER